MSAESYKQRALVLMKDTSSESYLAERDGLIIEAVNIEDRSTSMQALLSFVSCNFITSDKMCDLIRAIQPTYNPQTFFQTIASDQPVTEKLKAFDTLPAILNTFNSQYEHMQSYDLTKQRECLGNALQRPLPVSISMKLGSFKWDSYFLEPVGGAHIKFIKVLDKQYQQDVQSKSVIAIAEASQGGKTKLFFSTAIERDSSWFVVNIRFIDTDIPSDIFCELEAALELLYNRLTQNDQKDKYQWYSRRALDYVRLYVVSHLLWLQFVSNTRDGPSEDAINDLRACWMHALRNGSGSRATAVIFKKLTQGIKDAPIENNELHEEIQSFFVNILETVSKDRKVLFAFDEFGHTKDMFPGLFYHTTSEESERQAKEFKGQKIPPRDTADLFYGFGLLIKEITRANTLVVVADTQFSMQDVSQLKRHSALNGRVVHWSELETMSPTQLCDAFFPYFFTSENYKAKVAEILVKFVGRPGPFFLSFFSDWIVLLLKKKPGTEEEVWNLLETNIDEMVKASLKILQDVVSSVWESKQTIGVNSMTRGHAVRELHVALCVADGNVTLSDTVRAQDLVSCGILFAPSFTSSLTQKGDEPIIINLWEDFLMCQALKNFGNYKLTSVSEDHVLEYIQNIPPVSMLQQAVKGVQAELEISWKLIKYATQTKNTSLEDVLTPFFPENFTCPTLLQDCTTSISRIHIGDGKKSFEDLFMEGGNSIVLVNINNKARTDIAFLFKSDDKQCMFAIQSKNKTNSTNLQDALFSVTPGCQFFKKEVNIIKDNILNSVLKSEPNSTHHKFGMMMSKYDQIDTRWARGLYLSKDFAPKLVEWINELNIKSCTDQPIILLKPVSQDNLMYNSKQSLPKHRAEFISSPIYLRKPINSVDRLPRVKS